MVPIRYRIALGCALLALSISSCRSAPIASDSPFPQLAGYCAATPLQFNREFGCFYVDPPCAEVRMELAMACQAAPVRVKRWAAVLLLRLHVSRLIVFYLDGRPGEGLGSNAVLEAFYSNETGGSPVVYLGDGRFFGDGEAWLVRNRDEWTASASPAEVAQVDAWLQALDETRRAVVTRLERL